MFRTLFNIVAIAVCIAVVLFIGIVVCMVYCLLLIVQDAKLAWRFFVRKRSNTNNFFAKFFLSMANFVVLLVVGILLILDFKFWASFVAMCVVSFYLASILR